MRDEIYCCSVRLSSTDSVGVSSSGTAISAKADDSSGSILGRLLLGGLGPSIGVEGAKASKPSDFNLASMSKAAVATTGVSESSSPAPLLDGNADVLLDVERAGVHR